MAVNLDDIDAMAHDDNVAWQTARANGWRPVDGAYPSGRVEEAWHNTPGDGGRKRPFAPDNRDAATRVATLGPKFITARPRADRLVYVLLGQLAALDAEAGRVGREWYDAKRDDMTVDAGSNFIDRLRAKIESYGPAKYAGPPKYDTPAPVTTPAPDRSAWVEWDRIAAQLVALSTNASGARFAIDNAPGADNDISFWWITEGKGNWAGKYYLRQYIGGQGGVKVPMSADRRLDIARRIVDAPGGAVEAMRRFGREIGRCGDCGRSLTKKSSRDKGIGPWCEKKG